MGNARRECAEQRGAPDREAFARGRCGPLHTPKVPRARRMSQAAGIEFTPGSSIARDADLALAGRDHHGAQPSALAVDSAYNVYVLDTDNHTIRKIVSAAGVVTCTRAANLAVATAAPQTSARYDSFDDDPDDAGAEHCADESPRLRRQLRVLLRTRDRLTVHRRLVR